ncbi:MAG: CsgG/HfaB family protein [Candidatus Krumholzibacteria bacterium]|nr:CsgG/HfaB family protein [Candidatus Krumholzibacteria bacterium]
MMPRHSAGRLLRVRPFVVATALVVAVLPVVLPPAAAAATESVVDQVAQVYGYYGELEFEKGIALANAILAQGELEVKDRIEVYSALSLLTFALGESYIQESYAYLDRIAALGPCVTALPASQWPQQLRDQWYGVAHTNGALVCNGPTTTEDRKIRTVAIMEFDNFSVGKYQEKLGFLAKGLAEFFEADFSQLSELNVVERDKIDYILKEIMLAKEGMVEQSTAVQAGKLLGAQVMIFGSLVQLDDRNARMTVKAVNVETSQIIATAERQGKPDFFAMEKELVKELAGRLDLTLSAEVKARIDEVGTRLETAADFYSHGLYHMDRYEYAEAYDFFRKAWEADPAFAEAKHKMDIYRPLALSS